MKAVVVIPTYNERDNIPLLIKRIRALPLDLDLFFVDDASPDGTGELLDDLRSKYSRLRVMHRPRKLGLGTAYREACRYLLKESYDRFFMMDADLSHPPESLPALFWASGTNDLVIGSRYCAGGQIKNWPVRRKVLSSSANQIARTLLGLKIKDITSGFRCYRREVMISLDSLDIRSTGFSFFVEMTYHSMLMGYRVGEVPILFHDRLHAKSKMSRSEILGAMRTLLRLWLQRVTKNGAGRKPFD